MCWSGGWCEAEDGQEQGFVVFDGADGAGDACVPGLADEPDGEVTQRRQDARPGAGPDFAGVLGEGDVADPVV